MEQRIQNRLVTFDDILVWGTNNPLTPPIARYTALQTAMSGVVTALRTNGTSQVGGNAQFRSGITTRRQAADELLTHMRAINLIARSLPRLEFPGVRQLFRMPHSNGYAAIISTGQSFVEKVGPIKATFVERGLPADFDEQLSEALDNVLGANTDRATGKAVQVGGTAGLEAKAREGMAILHEMDSILSFQYRNDPVLLAGWKSTCHVERNPVHPKDGPGGGGSTPLALNAGGSAPGSGSAAEQVTAGVEPQSNGTNGTLIG
jgi:hypothetical protein